MRAREIILESRVDFVLRTMAAKLEKFMAQHPNEGSAEALVTRLAEYDPSRDQKYLPWIARTVLDGTTKLEDAYRLKDDLASFDALKNQLERRDINAYRSGSDLAAAIRDVVPVASRKAEKRAETERYFQDGEAELVHRDEQLQVIKPKTQRASCYFGRGTKWCTAATKSDNRFDSYNKTGPLYIINVLGSRDHRYQLHFPSGQFMDIHDDPADWHLFLQRYPRLRSVFSSQLAWLGGPARGDIEQAIEQAIDRQRERSGRYGDDDYDDEYDDAPSLEDVLDPEDSVANTINLMDRDDQDHLLDKYPELIQKINFATPAQQKLVLSRNRTLFKHIMRPDDSHLEAILQNPRTYTLDAGQLEHLTRNMDAEDQQRVYGAVLKHHPKIYWSLRDRAKHAETYFRNGGSLTGGYMLTPEELVLAARHSPTFFNDLARQYEKDRYFGQISDDDLVKAAENARFADLEKIPTTRLSDDLIERLIAAAPGKVTKGLLDRYSGKAARLVAPHVADHPMIVMALDPKEVTPGMMEDLMRSKVGVGVALRMKAPASAFRKNRLIDYIEAMPQDGWERHVDNIPGLADDADVRKAITKALEIDAARRREKEAERARWVLTPYGWDLRD